VQVGLNEEVGSFPPSAGDCESDHDGCEATMEQIQSGLAGLHRAPSGVRAAPDDVREHSGGCDPVSDDYINDRETYQQLPLSYDAGR